MKIFIEKKNDDESAFEIIQSFNCTKKSKDYYESTTPTGTEVIREHLCDHNEPEGSPYKKGCKVNEKDAKGTRRDTLRKYFIQFSDSDAEFLGKSTRHKEAEKIDGRLV